MKRILKWLIIKTLELIEKYEYRDLDLDENDISKKIIDTKKVKNIKVKSDTGDVEAFEIHKTQPYTIWEIKLENGYSLKCADNHIIFTSTLEEIFVADLKIGDLVSTDIGDSKVISIEKTKDKLSMFDLSINHPNHRYYTNGILSHNTITSAITILYYCIFETDKNIMIAANKKATTDEIVSKIKDIYYYLPFFLKPGVVNWNQSQITFGDTNCKIRSSAATKTAAIGFTIDLLFLDEFAHVPANVVDDYFRSIFPTVSNIKNSKIIITSTPNGYNLFWKLLSDAEKPDGDRDKNEFNSMRVPWHIVSGRFVTYLRIDDYAMGKHNITRQELYQWVRDMGFSEEVRDEEGFMVKEGLKIIKNGENNKWEIHIPNYDYFLPKDIRSILDEKEWNNPLSDYFRTLSFNKTITTPEGEEREKRIKLLELCDISSWKENAIKNIGSLDAFNQEYDLQFLSGAKMVLDASTMNKIENNIEPFEYLEIPAIEKSLFTTYESLTWIKDRPDLFNLANVKDYYMCASVDISEGLNGDYSVINFFRLLPKEIDEYPSNIKNMYELFKLEQVGIFHSNTTSVQELAELAYVIFFEMFNEDKIGVVLEANNWGNEFTKTMQEMFNGRNEYSSHIFYRYKHTQDAEETKIGIKLRSQKNMLVKGYQKALKRGDIMVHHHPTLQEMTKFIKKETAMNYTFKADAGANDDCVPPNTLIHTKKGIIPIIDVNIGDYVLTHKGRWRKVTKIGNRYSEKIYKIKSRKKLDLFLTSNHNIYTSKKDNRSNYSDNFEWVNIDSNLDKTYSTLYIDDKSEVNIVECIKLSDYCNMNKYIEKDGILYSIMYENKDALNPKFNPIKNRIELDDDFCFILGYYLAEGSHNNYQITFTGHIKEDNFRKIVTNWCDKNNIKWFIQDKDINTRVLVISSKPLRNFFNTFSVKNDKKLPRFLTNLNNEKSMKILEGYLLGDATFTSNYMRVCSISPTIAFDIYEILYKMGYHPSINEYKNNKNKIFSIEISEVEKIDLLSKMDDGLLENKNIKVNTSKKRNVKYSKNVSGYHASSITNIEEVEYNDLVYNLEVEEDNSYIANGIIVHNCVMTIVHLATVFDNYKFHDLVANFLSELPEHIRREVEKALQEAPTVEAVDYSILNKVGAVTPKPQYGRPDGQGNPFSSFGNNNPYTSGNPWKNLGDSTSNTGR